MSTDQELLLRFAHHADSAAFEAFLSRHEDMVINAAMRTTRNRQDAEDVLQSVSLTIALHARRLAKIENVAGWIYKLSVRTSLNYRRGENRRKHREIKAASDSAIMAIDAAMDAERHQLKEILKEELAQLPPKYKEPIVLLHVEGLATPDAAERLGLPTKTFATRLLRGRHLLSQRLARRGVLPPKVKNAERFDREPASIGSMASAALLWSIYLKKPGAILALTAAKKATAVVAAKAALVETARALPKVGHLLKIGAGWGAAAVAATIAVMVIPTIKSNIAPPASTRSHLPAPVARWIIGSALDFAPSAAAALPVSPAGGNTFQSSSLLGTTDGLSRWLGHSATLTAWVKPHPHVDHSLLPCIAGVETSEECNDIRWGILDNSGRIGIQAADGATAWSATQCDSSAWHHVALTRDEATGNVQVFIDGKLEARTVSAAGPKTDFFDDIGALRTVTGHTVLLPASLYDVCIFDRPLAAEDVAKIASSSKPPSER